MREVIDWHRMSKLPSKSNTGRDEVHISFAFKKKKLKPKLNELPTSPGVVPSVNRQVYSRAALRGMPNICFIC